MQSSSRGQGNFRGLEASRPRTSKCVLEDSTSANNHSDITFSKELETNNHLAYLDTLINTSNCKFETSVFRKKTNTGLFTKWNRVCPLKYKRNLVRYLLSKAYRICSTWPNIRNEFETITNMLLKNQRWSPRGHILKSLALASKPQVLENCHVLISRTALFLNS